MKGKPKAGQTAWDLYPDRGRTNPSSFAAIASGFRCLRCFICDSRPPADTPGPVPCEITSGSLKADGTLVLVILAGVSGKFLRFGDLKGGVSRSFRNVFEELGAYFCIKIFIFIYFKVTADFRKGV